MKNKKEKEILHALSWRYATKIFDPSKKVEEDDISTILESARLSPSSFGIEMWKFIIVKDKAIRTKLRAAGYDQPKITDASHLIVITYRTDAAKNLTKELIERTAKAQNVKADSLGGFKAMLDSTVAQKLSVGTLESWVRTQTYIPLGIMIETAALLSIDTGPMEGFDNGKVDEILGLAKKNLKSVTMLTLGYRGDDPASARPKVRRTYDEVIEII